MPLSRSSSMFLLLALAACGGGKSPDELAKLDRELAAAADPAVTAALEDPIMTDRDLSVQDDSRRVRHIAGPAQAVYPPNSKANIKALSGLDALAPGPACETGFVTGDAWARKLPSAFALYPGAILTYAAGTDQGGCRVRVASFGAPAPPQAIVDFYRARATRAGYSATPQTRGSDRILTGTGARNASYYLIVSPRASGSEVALLTSGG